VLEQVRACWDMRREQISIFYIAILSAICGT